MLQAPPFRLTGNAALDWAVLFVAILGYLYWLKALRLASDSARPALLLILGGFCIGLAYYFQYGVSRGDKPIADGMLFAFLAFIFVPRRKRSRYISAKVRKAVIALDLKGQKYDSRKHHIDHKWAYSRGGSNTIDNLRVIDRAANLRKGAKRPGIWDMFFR